MFSPDPPLFIHLVPDLESNLTFEDQAHRAITEDVRLVSSLQRITDTKSSLKNEDFMIGLAIYYIFKQYSEEYQ